MTPLFRPLLLLFALAALAFASGCGASSRHDEPGGEGEGEGGEGEGEGEGGEGEGEGGEGEGEGACDGNPCPECGDGVCDDWGETCYGCPEDCGECASFACGDGVCDWESSRAESCVSCPSDCGPCRECGNGVCEEHEYASDCPQDCDDSCGGPDSGRDECDPDEDCASCPSDCGPCFGDGVCGPGEGCGPDTDCGPCACPDVVTVRCGETVTGTTCGADDEYETGCAPAGTEDVLFYVPWVPGDCWAYMWTIEPGFANTFYRVPELVGCPGVREHDCSEPCENCSQGVQIPCGEDMAVAIERGDGGCGEFTFTLDCEPTEW